MITVTSERTIHETMAHNHFRDYFRPYGDKLDEAIAIWNEYASDLAHSEELMNKGIRALNECSNPASLDIALALVLRSDQRGISAPLNCIFSQEDESEDWPTASRELPDYVNTGLHREFSHR